MRSAKTIKGLFRKNSKGVETFDEKIHSLRGNMLSELKLNGGTSLHVGCSGNWYFEWIDSKVNQKFDKTIGLEKYSPAPSNLPPEIQWVASCAGHFAGIMEDSINWIYSGQNLEHLWEKDFVSFFEEASRVCKTGGLLSLDTPNVEITSRIGWNHPQHVAEFQLASVIELLELVGFDVREAHGIYHVDFTSIEPERLFFGYEDNRKERKSLRNARSKPDESFIFWVNAVKTDRKISPKFFLRAHEIFEEAFSRRLLRMQDGAWRLLRYEEELFVIEPETPSPSQMNLALPPGKCMIRVILNGEREDIEGLTVNLGGVTIEGRIEQGGEMVFCRDMTNLEALFGFNLEIIHTRSVRDITGKVELCIARQDCH
jgi:SAM-dependent methyltransferase